MFAYHVPNDATWHTCAKFCPTTCLVQLNYTSRTGMNRFSLKYDMVLARLYF